ncbi:MAG: heparan-alpha-glucosaminide N-acetyltransferase [Betaproteobacteria bacterium]
MPAARSMLKRLPPGAMASSTRIGAVDALRGVAIVAMVAYHLSFDLALFRLARFDFEHDLFWLCMRAAIVATFMGLVGVSLDLARRQNVAAGKRWRRIAVIAGCALAVSVATLLAFPRTWIWFGILHCIAAASVIAWPFARHPRAALAAGIVAIAAGVVVSHPAFDSPWLAWIGFATVKPATEDYVPLFPWLGVALVGIAVGDLLAKRPSASPLSTGSRVLPIPLDRPTRHLRWLGRHSLVIYMVHQPLLIGMLALFTGRFP